MSTALASIGGLSKILAVGGLAANIAGTVFSGISANKAAQEEADDIEFQAQLQREESQEEADRLDKKNKKFLAMQSLRFLKGGVTLADSPLIILQETREESAKESGAVRKRGKALFSFGIRKAARTRASGRSAFIGSLFSGLGTAGVGAFELNRLGVFK